MEKPKTKFWRDAWFRSFGLSSRQIIVISSLLFLLFVGSLFSFLQEKENSVPLLEHNEQEDHIFDIKAAEIESLWYAEKVHPIPSGFQFGDGIDINQATEEELMALPGIGPTLAKRMLDFREKNGRFLHLEDVKKVKGIGEKTYNKLKPYIKINL